MKRKLLILAIGFSMTLQAQGLLVGEQGSGMNAPVFETSAKDEIATNRFFAGSNYLDYDRQLTDKALTPAPKNYEPYYMSHYGRHGSRWLISDGNYSKPLATLKAAKEQGKLTPLGEKTLATIEAIYTTAHKRLGDLTTVGERQHHGIGKRMVQHFPEIFKTKNLKIDARSTTVNRCILSMIAECEELAAANPTAQIHNDVSESLQYYLNQPRSGKVKEARENMDRESMKAFSDKNTHPERLMMVLFNDPRWTNDSIQQKQLMRQLFEVVINMQSHDDGHDMLNLFTNNELYDQWRIDNVSWYMRYANAPQTGNVMAFSQYNLLTNIIETADTCVALGKPQATMRFGHEVCVMPLACLMELGNCGASILDFEELEKYWQNYKIFPMGCNIQLIFYKPKSGEGDILVKALLNEREVTLPVASTSTPYYYKWADLRKYWADKLAKFAQ